MGLTGSKIPDYNAAIASRAPTWGSDVAVVDQHTDFDTGRDLADDLHPSAAGDRLMAGRWHVALSQHVLHKFDELGRPVRILPFGDSITQMSYRWDLWLQLSVEMPQKFDLVGTKTGLPDAITPIVTTPALRAAFDGDYSGYPGYTAGELATCCAFRDTLAVQPDIVLLHAGTNDFKHVWGVGDTPVEQALTHLQACVTEMLRASPNATVLVAQIIPADPQLWILITATCVPCALALCVLGLLLARRRRARGGDASVGGCSCAWRVARRGQPKA